MRRKEKTLRTLRSRNAVTGYLFILPFIIGFIFFMATPLIDSFIMSLSDATLSAEGMTKIPVGFSNYHYALQIEPEFNQLLVDEIVRMVTHSLATMVLSFMIALLLNQHFKGRTLARAIFFLPVILASGVLVGVETDNSIISDLKELIQENNGINITAAMETLLQTSGLNGGAMDVVFELINSIYDIMMASGIQIVIFLSGLQTVPRSLYEAAEVEGCSAWESFWMITFPIVSPLLIVNMIYTITDFFMKTDNEVMELISDTMYIKYEFGISAAMSWIYFAVTIVMIGISALIIQKGVKQYE